jgi:site-specific recombinase XerD
MLARQIKPAAASAQIGTEIGWHTFRHTYSCLLRQLGVDVKVQQELMRHSDIRTTMNVYTQAVSEQKRSAQSSVVRLVLPLVNLELAKRLDISGH